MSTWEIKKVLTLRGPNRWGLQTANEAWLASSPGGSFEVTAPWRERMLELARLLLPDAPEGTSLTELTEVPDRCAPGEILARVAAALQVALGQPRPNWHVVALPVEAVEQVIVPFALEQVGRACLDEAVAFCQAVASGQPTISSERWQELRSQAQHWRPHVLWQSIARVAAAREVPWLDTPTTGLCQLGWGSRQLRLPNAQLADTALDAAMLVNDAGATWRMLQWVGAPMFDPDEPVPVPNHRLLVVGGQVLACLRAESVESGTKWVADDTPIPGELAAQVTEGSLMLGLDVAEFWLATPSLAQPLDGTTCGITRVTNRVDVDEYCRVVADVAPRIATTVVDGYCRRQGTGRIPVICITGTNGKTTTVRLCAHLLSQVGHRVGLTSTDGVYLAGRRIDPEDCSGPRSARRVLLNPTIDAAVLETARGGILREGMGIDRCDVAIVTNIGAGDHLGIGGIHTAEQIAEVKRTIITAVGPRGFGVLNANDPLTVAMAEFCPGQVIFFGIEGSLPTIERHRAQGGRAVFVADGAVVFSEGARTSTLMSLDEIPLTWGGRVGFQVENVLAAAAACWALDLPREALRAGLSTFQSTFDQAPARFNLFEISGATVIVDYGHNTSSLRALLPTLEHFPAQRRIAVFTSTGDRRDIDMVEQGRMLGDAFDEIVIFADRSLRGRDPAQIGALMAQGVQQGQRVKSSRIEFSFCTAAQQVLDQAQAGDLILLQADDFNQSIEYLRGVLDAQRLRPATDGGPRPRPTNPPPPTA